MLQVEREDTEDIIMAPCVLLLWLHIAQHTHNYRVVTWYLGSGLKAQNITGIRAQRKGLRAQKSGIRDHKAFEPESELIRDQIFYTV